MLVTLLAISIFLACWLALIVTGFLGMRTKSKLKKVLKQRHPEIRSSLSGFDSGSSSTENNHDGFAVFGVLLTFGSKKKCSSFLNSFVDVQAIENSEDLELKKLLSKSLKLISRFSKLWIVMVASIAIAVLFWP